MQKKQSYLIIVIMTISIIALASGVFLVKQMSHRKTNPAGTLGNTSGNLQNKGLFCENDGIVYFSNAYDNGSLYSMNPDETNIKKIASGNIQYINAAGKYLYCYSTGSESGDGLGYLFNSAGFFRIKKNSTKNPEYIKKSKGNALSLIGNTLYYQTYDSGKHLTLFRSALNGEKEKLISPIDMSPLCIAPSGFYFSQPDTNLHLQYCDVATDNVTEILDQDIYQPILDDNFIYFIDVHRNYGISCVNLLNGHVSELIDERVDCFNVANGMIYFQTSGNEYALKSATIDGSNITTIADGVYHSINITSQYVYFKQFNADVPIYKVPIGGTEVTTFTAAEDAIK